MEASVLIVSKNRCTELHRSLKILQEYIDKEKHEILVFLDGCTDNSKNLIEIFPAVKFEFSEYSLGASRARSILYSKARGKILYGFDDDSHPLEPDFIKITEALFLENDKLGILAFKEIKGVYASDNNIPLDLKEKKEDYFVKDFLGCGFAIKKEIYDKTRGFPVWIDIYGEEVCVAIETLELGYDILYTHQIMINHRTEKQKLNKCGANYYRFEKQLKNTASFYLVYYPISLVSYKLARLFILNFQKYGIKDLMYLKGFWKAVGLFIYNFKNITLHRKPVPINIIKKFEKLPNPQY
ncbi:glycosyltransferase family 2 protein [Salegentibacter sp. HM20]